jgi:hypothetical protein
MCQIQCADKHLASKKPANGSSLYLAIHLLHRRSCEIV